MPLPTGTVFRIARLSAVVLPFVFSTIGALFCLAMVVSAVSIEEFPAAVVLFAGFLLFAVRRMRQLVRPQRWIEVSGDGLTVGNRMGSRRLSWSELARARVVEDGGRPCLVVWLRDSGVSRTGLGATVNGGLRVFPVGHERRRTARLRELRAALGWYGRTVYDPNP